MFFKENLFNEWKKNNKNASLSYLDISGTKTINGLVFSSSKDERLIQLSTEQEQVMEQMQKGIAYVTIKTNELIY